MTTIDAELAAASDIIHTELQRQIPAGFTICRVITELAPGPRGEEYLRATVVLEDNHPQLDARFLNEFSHHLHERFVNAGIRHATVAYADRSELQA